jgi:hypothetical protein
MLKFLAAHELKLREGGELFKYAVVELSLTNAPQSDGAKGAGSTGRQYVITCWRFLQQCLESRPAFDAAKRQRVISRIDIYFWWCWKIG